MKDWMARNKERVSSYYRGRREPDMRRGRVRDQHKERARKIAWRAVRSGELVPQPCEGCGLSPDEKMADGRRKVQAHHDDYEAPLEVRWLCQVCHGREHRDHQLGKEEP